MEADVSAEVVLTAIAVVCFLVKFDDADDTFLVLVERTSPLLVVGTVTVAVSVGPSMAVLIFLNTRWLDCSRPSDR